MGTSGSAALDGKVALVRSRRGRGDGRGRTRPWQKLRRAHAGCRRSRVRPRGRGGMHEGARARGRAREQRRNRQQHCADRAHDARGLEPRDPGQLERSVPLCPCGRPCHGRAGLGSRGQHRLRCRAPARPGSARLLREQGGRGRVHPLRRPGIRTPRHHGQRCSPWPDRDAPGPIHARAAAGTRAGNRPAGR